MSRVTIALRSVRRESRNGVGYGLKWFVRRFYLRYIRSRLPLLPPAASADRERPLTIVVPAVEKDIPALGPCLEAAREMVGHRVTAWWVVAPESARLREVARATGWDFVPEDTILPRPAAELKCRGWILQQLIKLNASLRAPTDDYLVLDSDTVFLRPQSFFRGGRAVLRYSDQYELLYNRSLELVFGHQRRFPVSFVTHHMLLNRSIVQGLLALIERRFNRRWWEAIIREVDQGHPISFSEYELYGNYVVSQERWQREHVLEYWAGLDREAKDLPLLAEPGKAAIAAANSISFHWHTQ